MRRDFRHEGSGRRYPDQGRGRRGHAGAQRSHQLSVVRTLQWSPPDIFDANAGYPIAFEFEQFGCFVGDIDEPITVVWPAVIDAQNERFAIGDIGYPRITGHGERGMRGGQGAHIEHLAIGGQPAVEVVAVPGGQTLLAIAGVLLWHIDPPAYGIGFADPVSSSALRHGLAVLTHWGV